MVKIPTAAARIALKSLLANVKRIDMKRKLPKTTVPDGAPRVRPGTRARTDVEWQDLLELTLEEIQQWCDSFSIDGEPKSRAGRTNRSRR